MSAVIDYPESGHPISPMRFNVRGWVWLEAEHGEVVAVEACDGDVTLGRAWALQARPDVTAALGLSAEVKNGFDFFADHAAQGVAQFEMSIRAVFRDGRKSGALCTKLVSIREVKPTNGGQVAGTVSPGRNDEAVRPSESTEGAESDLILPPDHLQIRQVGGVWGKLFYTEGRVMLDQIARLCEAAGKPFNSAERILDFGCGCGRLLWNFQHIDHRAELWGCDIDGESISWSQSKLGYIGRFSNNPHLPPTEFGNGYFDVIYSVSVFTHLPEELQFAWLCELRRILAPGGIAVISLHGGHYWSSATEDVRKEVVERGFAYRTGAKTEGLPDFYMVAYHSEDYVRARWAWFFEIIEIRPRYIHGLHDAVVVRRRAD